MRTTKRNVLIVVLSGLIVSVANASDFLECPMELAVKQTIQGEMADWVTFNSDEKHPYVGVSFSEGSPEKKVILAPGREKKVKGGIQAIWNFPISTEGYWVSCLYAETSATVAQRLPSSVKSCEVDFDVSSSPPLAKQWRCSMLTKK